MNNISQAVLCGVMAFHLSGCESDSEATTTSTDPSGGADEEDSGSSGNDTQSDSDSADESGENSDFGSTEDQKLAEKLWKELDDYTQWSNYPGLPGVLADGAEPHARYQRQFVNDVAADDIDDLPDGSIIVKENFMDEDLKIGAITVMKKIAGYNPDAGDWFWAKFKDDGSLHASPDDVPLAGKVTPCIGCHVEAKGDDFVFPDPGLNFGTEADVERAEALWSRIEDSYPDWAGFPGKEGVVEGTSDVHGAYVRVLINDLAAEDPNKFDYGSIVVKENFSTEAEDSLVAITVGEKIRGYHPAGGDWFWVKYDMDGAIANNADDEAIAGQFPGCVGCHASAGDDDQIFFNDDER